MAKIKNRKKLIAIATAALLVAGGSTAAFAYWTSAGAGDGAATTGTNTGFIVETTGTTGPLLVPGGAPQSIGFTVENPAGAGTQFITNVVATVANADGTEWVAVPGCSAADYEFLFVTKPTGQIPADTTKVGTVQVKMVNDSERNQDACKEAPVPVYIAAS